MFKNYEGLSFEEQIKNGKYNNILLESTGKGIKKFTYNTKHRELEKQKYNKEYINSFKRLYEMYEDADDLRDDLDNFIEFKHNYYVEG